MTVLAIVTGLPPSTSSTTINITPPHPSNEPDPNVSIEKTHKITPSASPETACCRPAIRTRTRCHYASSTPNTSRPTLMTTRSSGPGATLTSLNPAILRGNNINHGPEGVKAEPRSAPIVIQPQHHFGGRMMREKWSAMRKPTTSLLFHVASCICSLAAVSIISYMVQHVPF